MKHLLLSFELKNWDWARSYSYFAYGGLGKALRNSGENVDFFILPCDDNFKFDLDENKLLKHYLLGERYDVVWIYLIHFDWNYNELHKIFYNVPIRIGVCLESLQYYDWEFYQFGMIPKWKKVYSRVIEASKFVTHYLVIDEVDVDLLRRKTNREVFYYPFGVNKEFILSKAPKLGNEGIIIGGSNYGQRIYYLNDSRIARFVNQNKNAVQNKDKKEYEEVIFKYIEAIKNKKCIKNAINDYLIVREKNVRSFFERIVNSAAVLNLPSLCKSIPGRVWETFACGVPLITPYLMPDRVKANQIFLNNHNCLLYSRGCMEELSKILEKITADLALRERIGLGGLETAIKYCMENTISTIIEWIEKTCNSPKNFEKSFQKQQIIRTSFIQQNNLNLLTKFYNKNPDDWRLAISLGQSVLETGDLDQARQIFNAANTLYWLQKDDFIFEQEFVVDTDNQNKPFIKKYILDSQSSGPCPTNEELIRWYYIFQTIKNKMIMQMKAQALDVGCGRGWMTNLLACYFDAHGIDICSDLIISAQKLFPGINFNVLSLFDKVEWMPKFNLIVCSDLIQFIDPSLWGTMFIRLHDLLAENGVLIITCPIDDLQGIWMEKIWCLEGVYRIPSIELMNQFLSENFSESKLVEIANYDLVKGFQNIPPQGQYSIKIHQIWYARK